MCDLSPGLIRQTEFVLTRKAYYYSNRQAVKIGEIYHQSHLATR